MHRCLAIGAVAALALALCDVASAWSWPADGAVLRPFSLGEDVYAGGQHRGIDVAGEEGSPARAPASGLVTFAGSLPTHGRGVSILTEEGYAVTLVHLGTIGVATGDAVAEGSPVGTVGWSGTPEQSVPSVHLGIRRASEEEGYVDPLGLLPPRAVPPAPGDEPAPVTEPVAVAPAVPVEALPAPLPAEPSAAPAAPPATTPVPALPAPSTPASSATASPIPPAPQVPAAPVPPATSTEPISGALPAAESPLHSAPASSPVASPAPATPTRAPSSDVRRSHVVEHRSSIPPREAAAPEKAAPKPPALHGPSGSLRDRPRLVEAAPAEHARPMSAPARPRVQQATVTPTNAGASSPRPAPTERAAGVARPVAAATERGDGAAAARVREVTDAAAWSDGAAARGSDRSTRGEATRSVVHAATREGPSRLPEIVAAIALAMLLAGMVASRAARRIGVDGALLRHHADLLRQLDAAYRARVHHRGRGRVRAPSTPART